MSERAMTFAEGWWADYSGGAYEVLGADPGIDLLLQECLSEASFLGISREELENALGDLNSYFGRRLALAVATRPGRQAAE